MQAKKSLGMSREARAKWGQNFLRDKRILKKIADFAQIEKTDTVVEVGPGEGTLTELLLERAEKVIAIEKDERLAELLRENFKVQISNNKLVIVNADVLELPEEFFSNYKLVGNIPYYITGALFKKFLESNNQPRSITFVVQKEVAERIIARDNKESILSISIKAYGEPKYGGIIKAGSFNPKPKVDSAIIHIGEISKSKFEELTPLAPRSAQVFPCLTLRGEQDRNKIEEKFFKILKSGFAHKRKLLIKNLMSKGVFEMPLPQKTPFDIFQTCEIPEKARAENLSVNNWICLTKELM
jgi:16S rRNA (adenine1518-N6/adenine1519-N6)-dimethyltransferase